MGRLPTNKRKYQLSRIWERHQEILRLIVLGMSNKDIASQLKVTPTTVSYTRNSHLGQEIMGEMGDARDEEVKSIATRITDMLPKALNLYEGSLEGRVDGEKVPLSQRMKDAKEMLYMGGFKPVSKIDSIHTEHHFTGDDIIKIKERAKQLLEQNSKLVNVEEANFENVGDKNVRNPSNGSEGRSDSSIPSGGADTISGDYEESDDENSSYLHQEVSRLDQD